ncbi:hypothetical protein MNBD_ALPHA05-1234 [hydrothermal vent metagenome]|uniref:Uncharacterized protein n=1 Tax=hydrothermal vent metagenome TaxID=652676 RepID=A0A3B0SYD4_9ZZZZ
MGRPDRAAGRRPCEPFGFDVYSVSSTTFCLAAQSASGGAA